MSLPPSSCCLALVVPTLIPSWFSLSLVGRGDNPKCQGPNPPMMKELRFVPPSFCHAHVPPCLPILVRYKYPYSRQETARAGTVLKATGRCSWRIEGDLGSPLTHENPVGVVVSANFESHLPDHPAEIAFVQLTSFVLSRYSHNVINSLKA